MSRWSGFKAGHRISIRALFLIQNLGKKQKLGVGGFSVREVLVLCCHPVCAGWARGCGCLLLSHWWKLDHSTLH